MDLVSPALGLWVKRSALSLGDLKKNTYKSIFRLRTAELSLGSLPSSSPLLHGAQHCLLRNLQVTKGSLGSASATAHRPCLGQRTGPSAPGQMSPMARCSTSAKALEPVHGNSFNLPPLPPPTPINLFTATDVFTTRSKAGGEGGVLGASLTHWCEVCHPPFPVLQPWAGSPRLAGGCRLHGSGAGAQQSAGKRCQNWHWHWEVAPQGVCASPFPRASPRGLSQGFPCMSTSSVAHQLQNAPTVGNNLPETPPVLFPCIAALESGCPHLSLGTQLLLFPLPFHRHPPSPFIGIHQPCRPSSSGSSATVFAPGALALLGNIRGISGATVPTKTYLCTAHSQLSAPIHSACNSPHPTMWDGAKTQYSPLCCQLGSSHVTTVFPLTSSDREGIAVPSVRVLPRSTQFCLSEAQECTTCMPQTQQNSKCSSRLHPTGFLPLYVNFQ